MSGATVVDWGLAIVGVLILAFVTGLGISAWKGRM